MILGLSSIQSNQLLTAIGLLEIVQQVRKIVLLINTTVPFILLLNVIKISIQHVNIEWCPNFVLLESNFVNIDKRS
jgi:hypothetical protein